MVGIVKESFDFKKVHGVIIIIIMIGVKLNNQLHLSYDRKGQLVKHP